MDCQKLLHKLYACTEAREWIGERDLESAWNECERADWMLWFAARVGVDRKLVVLAACDCAETALKYVPEVEDRPRAAIEMARAWTRGEATIKQVRKAADAADAAADAAAYAADAAAAAAAYAADAVRARARRECAELVRRSIPLSVVQAAIDNNF